MKKTDFTSTKMNLIFKINKPLDFVFDYLTNMQRFASVHPVISKIDTLGNGNYLVHETLKFGIVPFSFTYPVSIKKNNNEKIVVMVATVMRLTKIDMNFILRSENRFTIINETIDFRTALPIKSLMQRIFKEQHEQLFQNIEKAT